MENVRILIVDDSEFIRALMKKFFENYNFEVIVCSTGLQGIKNISQKRPDVIFTDLVMPGFSGIDFIKSVRVLPGCADIPIIVVTSYSKDDLLSEVKKLGIKKILSKPLKGKEIIDVMDEILGGHALSKRKAQKLFNKEEEGKESAEEEIHKTELKIQAVKGFIKTSELWSRDLRSAIDVKNQTMLRTVVHDIRLQGAPIGYPRLKMLCDYVESLLDRKPADQSWKDIETFTDKLLEIMNVIKDENQESNSLDTK